MKNLKSIIFALLMFFGLLSIHAYMHLSWLLVYPEIAETTENVVPGFFLGTSLYIFITLVLCLLYAVDCIVVELFRIYRK